MAQIVAVPLAQKTLKLECDWNVGIGGSLWTSGLLLVNYLCEHGNKYNLSKRQKVIELGSGTGLVGLSVASLGNEESEVVLTDVSTHLNIIRNNVSLNKDLLVSRVNVEELNWGVTKLSEKNKQFDLILGTDVAYNVSLYEPLISTLKELSSETTIIILGISRIDTEIHFFHRLIEEGFEYYKVPEQDMKEEFRGKDCGLFVISKF